MTNDASIPTLFSQSLERSRPGLEMEAGPDEARHLRAARVRPGDPVAVTDGRGSRWDGELVGLDRRSARIRLTARTAVPAASRIRLLAPVGNRERSLWLVEKATELGAETIAWVECERSRSVADAGRSGGFLERAERRAIAALKQCGGAWLPRLVAPEPFDRALEVPDPEYAAWLADAAGESALAVAVEHGGGPLQLLVGPEGGLTEEERDSCRRRGYRFVRLGARTLRFETAAIALLALAIAAQREGTSR